MRRQGIALLITLSLIAAMAGLLAVSSGLTEKMGSDVRQKKFIVQCNILFADYIDMLQHSASDINDSEMLDVLLSLPLKYESAPTGISADIRLRSNAARPNINFLLKPSVKDKRKQTERKADPVYEAYLDRILSIYDVSDKLLFFAMLEDTIDTDLKARLGESEIAAENPFFTQGGIYSMKHFRQILEAYEDQTGDYSVMAIPWDKYIAFSGDELDINHMSADVLHLMVPDADPASLAALTSDKEANYADVDALPLDADVKKELKAMHAVVFSPDLSVRIDMLQDDMRYRIAFMYNLKTKEVRNVEVSF